MSRDEKQYYSSLLGVSNLDLPTFRTVVLIRQNGLALILPRNTAAEPLRGYCFAIFTF